MGIEDSLVGSYLFGKRNEIKEYVQSEIDPLKFTGMYFLELGIFSGLEYLNHQVIKSPVLSDVGWVLGTDMVVRVFSGVCNTVRNYIGLVKRDGKRGLFDYLDPPQENPGIVGAVRQLYDAVRERFL